MRLFLAIDIPDELREQLKPVLAGLKTPGMKPVAPENLHVTVKFLGDVDEAGLEWVKQQLKTLNPAPVALKTSHFGTFGKRTYWLGVESPGLKTLAEQVNIALQSRFQPERRDSPLHITLARAKGASAAPGDWQPTEGGFEAAWEAGLVLYESELRPEGAKYRKIAF